MRKFDLGFKIIAKVVRCMGWDCNLLFGVRNIRLVSCKKPKSKKMDKDTVTKRKLSQSLWGVNTLLKIQILIQIPTQIQILILIPTQILIPIQIRRRIVNIKAVPVKIVKQILRRMMIKVTKKTRIVI